MRGLRTYEVASSHAAYGAAGVVRAGAAQAQRQRGSCLSAPRPLGVSARRQRAPRGATLDQLQSLVAHEQFFSLSLNKQVKQGPIIELKKNQNIFLSSSLSKEFEDLFPLIFNIYVAPVTFCIFNSFIFYQVSFFLIEVDA